MNGLDAGLRIRNGGELSKWSFAGGRFTEKIAPWMSDSTFRQLREKLKTFYDDLPELFQWSTSNYYKHENHQASSVYVSMHMLGAVCRIMLNREYIPFIPIRCHKPSGPLDEPIFAPGTEPEGFWDESAEEVFKAARDIVDLIDICGNKLPMSALVLFAVWTAAFVGIYAFHFPQMDAKRHMLPSEDEETSQTDAALTGATGVTYETLRRMSGWLRMAETYAAYFREMDSYYEVVKQDFDKHTGRRHHGAAEGSLSVRLGGGGLKEWRLQRGKIVDNGAILAAERRESSPSPDSTVEPASSTGPDYNMDQKTPRSTSMSFTPINSAYQQQEYGESRPEEQAQHHWSRFQPQHPTSPSVSSNTASPQVQHGLPIQPSVLSNIPMPMYNSTTELIEFIAQNQSMPWHLVPGGIDHFAHGTENLFPTDTGNGFWGSMTEGVAQQVGSYS